MTKRLAVLGSMFLLIVGGTLAATQPDEPAGRTERARDMLARGAHTGPALPSYGPFVEVDSTLPVPKDHEYKVVFELTRASKSPEVYNDYVDSVARFINMHVAAGVPRENLDIKVVIHGQATLATMNDEAYRARYGVGNPNTALFEALSDFGVDIYVCGQAAFVLKVPHEQLAPRVELALSAMTAVALFQDEGYRLLPW